MGAATTLAFALEQPERVAALVQITPAHLGLPQTDEHELARWDALADGLERDGVGRVPAGSTASRPWSRGSGS